MAEKVAGCDRDHAPDWKKGPLPPDTYGWGAVVPFDADPKAGFYFADFAGDKVTAINADGKGGPRELQPHEVKLYNNSIGMPPTE